MSLLARLMRKLGFVRLEDHGLCLTEDGRVVSILPVPRASQQFAAVPRGQTGSMPAPRPSGQMALPPGPNHPQLPAHVAPTQQPNGAPSAAPTDGARSQHQSTLLCMPVVNRDELAGPAGPNQPQNQPRPRAAGTTAPTPAYRTQSGPFTAAAPRPSAQQPLAAPHRVQGTPNRPRSAVRPSVAEGTPMPEGADRARVAAPISEEDEWNVRLELARSRARGGARRNEQLGKHAANFSQSKTQIIDLNDIVECADDAFDVGDSTRVDIRTPEFERPAAPVPNRPRDPQREHRAASGVCNSGNAAGKHRKQ